MTVALVAIGSLNADALEHVADSIRISLDVDVRRAADLPEPEFAYDPGRRQYSSTLVLRDLLRLAPAADKLLGVTTRDLFIPMLSFVYGQAQVGGPAAVVSSARLRQEFYGMPPNRMLFLDRLRKEALHELGHCLGLVHCPDRGCPMALATNITQLDLKGLDFCSGCQSLLRGAIRGSAA